MAEVLKLITAWKESVGQRKWNIPKHCVCSCCSSLYVIISAELSEQEEQRNSRGLHSGVKETEEELQNDGMGVRASATKGKSESVLSWKLAWMWRTNKNKSAYLKGATGEGGSSEKKLHNSGKSQCVECERVNCSCDLTLWPCCYSSSPPFPPSFICGPGSIISLDLKSWLKLRNMLPRNEPFPWQHTAVLQFCVALQDVRTFSFLTTCSSSFRKSYETSGFLSSLWEGWQNQPALNHLCPHTDNIPNNPIMQTRSYISIQWNRMW